MDKQYIYTLLKRFARAFVTGGLSSMLVITATLTPDYVINNPKVLLGSLLIAFANGGLMAIEKAIRYTPNEEGQ